MINPFATTKELVVLGQLKEHGESYGLDLVRKSNGKLNRSSVYIVLGRLEEKGFVRSRTVKETNPGLPRPRYSLTEAGERMLEASRVAFNQT